MPPNNAVFDAIANQYDAIFTQTAAWEGQRKAVWQYVAQYFLNQESKQCNTPPFFRILELNCGTGHDAAWFAQHNCNVLATDISSQMIAVAQQKIADLGLADWVTCQVLDTQHLSQLPPQYTNHFDLIFSNFGGLNCLSPHALQAFAMQAAACLKPNGRLILVVMGTFCWHETAYFCLKGQLTQAIRRLKKGKHAAHIGNQVTIDTWYYRPGRLAKLLAPHFKPIRKKPIGIAFPPSYLNPVIAAKPRLIKALSYTENCLGKIPPLAYTSDHYLIDFVKQNT